jgi:hypothetical protein
MIEQLKFFTLLGSVFFSACSLFLEDPTPYPQEKDLMVEEKLPMPKDRDINTGSELDANLSTSSKSLILEDSNVIDQTLEQTDMQIDDMEP